MRQERKLSRPVGPYLWTTGPGGVVFLNREGDEARPIRTVTLSASGQVDGRLGRGPVSPPPSWFGTGSSTGLGSVTDECLPHRGVLKPSQLLSHGWAHSGPGEPQRLSVSPHCTDGDTEAETISARASARPGLHIVIPCAQRSGLPSSLCHLLSWTF